MTLQVTHFDTLTKQNLDIEENIKNSLAEYLFPDTEFAIGSTYEDITTAEHLDTYQDKTLQFASGERMYFADKEIRNLLYQNQSDGAAYGSLVFTPCQEFKEINAKVLVINDETGANGGIMPSGIAKELVGDCYGKISPEIAEQLTNSTKTPFQFRLGIKPQADSSVYRIAKGTLAPASLDNLSGTQIITQRSEQGKLIAKTGYDLILPTSSFKGRKEGYDPIQPGEYNLKVGIGIKTLAQYGEQSLGTQVLVNYPKAVSSEILSELEKKAENLAEKQSTPQQLAQHYIEVYEKRKQAMRLDDFDDKNINYDQLEGLDKAIDDAFGDEDLGVESTTEQDWTVYRLLKADTQGKITDHPKIADVLNKFVRKQWVEIATGRAIKFQAGLAQPSLKLKEDEICIPHIPQGKEVIVTRSPLINSNGVIVLKNKHLPEVKHLQGAVHINPNTAAKHLQADFDGDRLAFETADKYPVLAAEVKEYNLEQNRYPNIVKRDKVAYKGTFQEIALSASENKIGLIANQIQRAVSNKWETYGLPTAQRQIYLRNVSDKMQSLLENETVTIPEKYQERVTQLANFPHKPTTEDIDKALDNLRTINFDLVSDLGNELQVAVDGPKSAARPNEELLNTLNTIGNYKYPKWLYEKKNAEAYLKSPMKSNGYSPIDLMIKQTNKTFKTSQVKESPSQSFRPLFEDVKFTPFQKSKAVRIKQEYNALIGRAVEAQKAIGKPVLKVTSATSGKTIEISNLKSINLIDKVKQLDIGIRHNIDGEKGSLRAVVFQERGIERDIGVVSPEQVREFGLKPGHSLRRAEVALDSGITKAQVKAMFSKVKDYMEQVRQQTPESQQQAMNSALWYVTHSKGDRTYNQKSTVALTLFPDELIKRLEQNPTQNLRVVGVLNSPDYSDRIWKGETVNCEVVKNTNQKYKSHSDKMLLVEGKPLAPFSDESASFQVGTKFKASITTPLGATAIATTARGNTIKIGELKNGAYPNVDWKGEKGTIKLDYQKIRGKDIPVVLLNGKRLGIVHRDSIKILQAKGYISKQASFPVTLQRSPSKTADLKVDLNSVIYPWQKQELQNKPAPELSKAQITAGIVKDFLKLKGSDEYQGKKYNATWKDNNSSLTLQNINGSTLLEAKQVDGQWQVKGDRLSSSDIRFFQDMKPKIDKGLSDLEAQKKAWRSEYEVLRDKIKSNPRHANKDIEKIDTLVATSVLQNIPQDYSDKPLQRVAEVLSQSDRLQPIRGTIPMSEYREKATNYVVQRFQTAQQINRTLGVQEQRGIGLSR